MIEPIDYAIVWLADTLNKTGARLTNLFRNAVFCFENERSVTF